QRPQNSRRPRPRDADPDDPFTKALRGTYNDLEAEKTAALTTIAQLDTADDPELGRPSPADIALLDALPYPALNLADAPHPLLRRRFEITPHVARLPPER